jgi:hypothetical protein
MRDMRQRQEATPAMDSELQAHIGRHLKAAYEDILNQPVPDRFRQLLDALSENEVPSSEETDDGKEFRS